MVSTADYSELDESIHAYGGAEHALIQVLHKAQELFGYLPKATLEYIGRRMNIPASEIHSVVTFYSFFNTSPPGRHKIMVCMGTACYVKGAQRIVDRLQRGLDVALSQTTKDQRYTLVTARCLGACGLAPAVVVDSDVHGRQTGDRIQRILKRYE